MILKSNDFKIMSAAHGLLMDLDQSVCVQMG